MNKVKVSVIITAYNMEKFIKQSIESVIDQSLRDIEIICIDDCSNDNTYNILQHYESIDNRIVVIKNKTNQGQSRSINLGLDLSKGEYVYFLDSDDYISNDFLYELYNTAINYNSDITQTSNIVSVFYDDRLGKDYKIEYNNKITELKKDVLYKENMIEGEINFSIKNLNIGNYKNIDISPWNKIVKREFILKNNLYFSYIENLKDHINDFNFFYKLLYNNPRASYNHKVQYFHRFRNNSFMSSSNNDINRIIAIIERMKDLFDYCYNKNSELVQYITPRIFCGLKYNFDIMDNKKEIYKYIHNYIQSLEINKNDNISNEDYERFILFKISNDYEDYKLISYLYDKKNTDISILKDIQNQNFNYIKDVSFKYNNFIYLLSWWIPVKKWREIFRNKFKTIADQTRPDQTRPDQTRPDQ